MHIKYDHLQINYKNLIPRFYDNLKNCSQNVSYKENSGPACFFDKSHPTLTKRCQCYTNLPRK